MLSRWVTRLPISGDANKVTIAASRLRKQKSQDGKLAGL
ncbi:UNVERIFIED_ORG: hypothetical protein BDU10_9804 [Burkholderia sp. CF145]|jgi:hypothetical protein